MAASALLNFANGIDFTNVDPLMDLVRTGDKLLSYATLSTGKFEEKDEGRIGYIRDKFLLLKSTLEERKLSKEDQGERIRLIIILDFRDWLFLKPEGACDKFDPAFPSLKAGYIKKMADEVFGSVNTFLERFDYNFIFLDNGDNKEKTNRYRLVAYHGFCAKGSLNNWISISDHKILNQKRKEAIENMRSPDVSLQLTSSRISAQYTEFEETLKSVLNDVERVMSYIGAVEDFKKTVETQLNPKTVDEFERCNYDKVVFDTIEQLAGLGSNRFRNCSFIFMDLPLDVNMAFKCKGEVVLKSLLQLMVTMCDEDYKTVFRPHDGNDIHKMFIMNNVDADDINGDALWSIFYDNEATIKKLQGLAWDDTKKVEFVRFTSQTSNVKNSHDVINAAMEETGDNKRKAFIDARSIPFFFGKHPGDWSWYLKVMDAFDDLFSFESSNDRPYYDNLTRSQEKKFIENKCTCTFGELKTFREQEAKSVGDIESAVDYDSYIANRRKKLDELADHKGSLKKALVKLGFLSRLSWIMVISSLAVTLCYAYHFIYGNNSDKPAWIAACLLVMCLLCLLGSVIAQIIVKNRINSVYRKIDDVLNDMRGLKEEYMKKVLQLAKDLDEADAHRKTLAEMDSEIDMFDSRSKRVELWIKHFDNDNGMNRIVNDIIKYLKIEEPKITRNDNWRLIEEVLNGVPSVPASIKSRKVYCDMSPKICITNITYENKFKNVTCFVSRFSFTCEQKQSY